MKLNLLTVAASDAIATLNENFSRITAELQDKVLYRDNPVGETNTMLSTLDMNGQRVINLPAPVAMNEAARLQDVQDAVSGLLNASLIPFSPTVNISATTVQGAIEETYAEANSGAIAVQANLDAYKADVLSSVNSAKGTSLIGYIPSFTGAVGRLLSDKLQDSISARDFGLHPSNSGAQNNTAMALAVAYAIAQGGLTLFIPRGTYNFASSINISGANNLRITGDGIDATILQINHATVDFIVAAGDYYQTIDNLTLTSSVTRSAGAMFKCTGFWNKGLFHRVKINKHYDGINLPQFVVCSIVESVITTPTGAGTGIIAGQNAASNQGANLTILNCFVRGNDEANGASAAIGNVGLRIRDVEAVYCINTDFGALASQAMVIEPQFSTANCFFTGTSFDATVNGENVLVQGAGSKLRMQFTGCWFATAGGYGGSVANQAGIRFTNNGLYADWNFIGCRFTAMTGPGVFIETQYADFNFTGCNFNNCGVNTSLNCAVYVNPATSQGYGALFSGCKFIAYVANTADFIFTANSALNVINGCQLHKGITYSPGATFGNVDGNSDPNTSDTIASAATLQVSPTKNFYTITGTTNVGGLLRTFTGHTITFVATGVFTWTSGGALVLSSAGNFVTAAGSTITLVCQPSGAVWREISRHT